MWTGTGWKMSKYGVFSGPYFPVFRHWIIYRVNLRIQSEDVKIWTRENSVFGHFSLSEGVNYEIRVTTVLLKLGLVTLKKGGLE